MDKIRVVIADDQSLITQSFTILLETKARDITVVGTARDGEAAVILVDRERPDVVLMDVRMPHMDGVQATGLIHRSHPEVKIIMLTTFDDDAYVHEAMGNGAAGYLLKDISTDELISAIRSVQQGTVLVSSVVAQKYFARTPSPPKGPPGKQEADTLALLNELTRKELDILRLLVQGWENKEIAQKLNAADQTIKNSVSVIYTKLGVAGRKEARRLALRSGLVGPEEILRNS